jgi:hypothetical protein
MCAAHRKSDRVNYSDRANHYVLMISARPKVLEGQMVGRDRRRPFICRRRDGAHCAPALPVIHFDGRTLQETEPDWGRHHA